MTGQVLALAALVVVGVIIADMFAHSGGTAALSSGVGGLLGTSVNGLLGRTG